MVSPTKKQKTSHETTPELDEQDFQQVYDKLLLSRLGNLPKDLKYNYVHSKLPYMMSKITAEAIHLQLLNEGYKKEDLPSSKKLVGMINAELETMINSEP